MVPPVEDDAPDRCDEPRQACHRQMPDVPGRFGVRLRWGAGPALAADSIAPSGGRLGPTGIASTASR
jgi:hypothetical protein